MSSSPTGCWLKVANTLERVGANATKLVLKEMRNYQTESVYNARLTQFH